MNRFFDELRRRRVPRVALVYVATAFAGLQAAELIVPRLLLPDWTITLLLILAFLGLPVALGLAWAFDVSGDGIRRTSDAREAGQGGGGGAGVVAGAQPTAWFGRRAVLAAAALALLGGGMSAGWILRPGSAGGAVDGDASIAALPFESMSDDREDAWFADGVHEEILTQLSRLSGLRVISRTSVMGYREQPKTVPAIAAELGVRYILEGSVRRFDNTVKVTAQLIDSRDDTHVWAEVYERPRTDLFAIQADVARRIADALNARISPREAELLDTRPTRDTDAHDLYLQGLEATRRYHSAAELHRAVDLFREATARDPAFAEALAGEAHAHLWLWRFYYDHTPAREAAARTAAEAALRVRPVPRAHYVLAQLHLESGRIDPALAEVRRLEEILPNSADVADVRASIHDRRGRWAEVEENRLLAIARDPRNPGSRLALGAFLMDRGRLAEARAAFEEALVLDPANVTATFLAAAMRMQLEGDGGPVRAALERTDDPFGLSLIYAWFVEQMDERFDEAARVAAAAPTDRIDWETFVFAPLAAAAESRMAAGDTAGARADYTALRGKLDGWLRDTPDDSRLHSLLAVTLSHLGERAGALAAVERALELATAAENADLRNEHLMTESIVYANAGDYDNAFAALERFLDANGGWGQAWSGSWLQGAPELQRTSQGTTILRRYPPEALPAPVVRY